MGSGNNTKGSWASDDDANDLLAGILDETEEDARSEEERIQAELEAQRKAEEKEKAEALERKRSDARARITAEQERLEGLEERRTMRQEALNIEEMKERGEWVEDEPEQAEADDTQEAATHQREVGRARQAARERADLQAEARSTQSMPSVDAPSSRSSAPTMVALAAVFALVAGAGATAFMLAETTYEPDASVYSKSVYEPREPDDSQIIVGFTPLNTADEPSEPDPAAREDRPSRSAPSRSAPSRPAPAPEPEPEESADPLVIDEDGFDPFSEGF